jgi:hypothetical protein
MKKDAAQVLGEPVTEDLILLARGASRKIRRQMGGAVGGLVAARMSKDTTPDQPAPEDYNRGGFLVSTPTRIALLALDDGRLKQKLGDVLATFSPGDLDRIEIGKAAIGVKTVDLLTTSGDCWSFELSKVAMKKLRSIAATQNVPVVDD